MLPRALPGDAARNLDAFTAFVHLAADGTRPVSEIAELAAYALSIEPDEERVFAALDELADLGLLERRVAPPARRYSRRQVFSGLTVGLGAAALAVTALPKDALASREEQEKRSNTLHVTADTTPTLRAEENEKRGSVRLEQGRKAELQHDEQAAKHHSREQAEKVVPAERQAALDKEEHRKRALHRDEQDNKAFTQKQEQLTKSSTLHQEEEGKARNQEARSAEQEKKATSAKDTTAAAAASEQRQKATASLARHEQDTKRDAEASAELTRQKSQEQDSKGTGR
jgi:hypothetical protein